MPTRRGRLKRRARECWVWWWEAGDAPMSVCRGERPKRNPYDNRGRWLLMREVSRRPRKVNRGK